MSNKIQIRRGNLVDLPILDAGELAVTLDEKSVYVGTGTENTKLLNEDQTDEKISAELDSKSNVGHTHTESEIVDLDKYSQEEVDTLLTGKENVGTASGAVSTHEQTYDHENIEHSNRESLDLVSGTNTGDQDLSGKEDVGTASGLISTHEETYDHSEIAHSNREALDNVSGTNTGDQDLTVFYTKDEVDALLPPSDNLDILTEIITPGAEYLIGKAVAGSLTSASVWLIKKVTFAEPSWARTWADGEATYTKTWDNRLSYTY